VEGRTPDNINFFSSSTAPTLPVPVTLPVTTPFVPVTVRPDSDLEFGVNRVVPFCTCDITPNACDVNCCCDEKCSADVREAFTSCDELSQLASTYSVCIPKSALFLQNSPFVVSQHLNKCPYLLYSQTNLTIMQVIGIEVV